MEAKARLASFENCTGCLACVDVCRRGAIKVIDKYNFLYPTIDSSICIDCGACEKICPIKTPISIERNLLASKVVAAWCADDKIRLNAASGGFCTAMSIDTIKKGGKVALCTWKDGKASFILTDDTKEIMAAANSKYVQSDASGIYRKIQKHLNDGKKVLFIGLPCQVGGLKSFLRNKQYDDKLRTIELICSAPPSVEAVRIQEHIVNKGKLLRFRMKTAKLKWGQDHNLQIQDEGSMIILEQGAPQSIFYKIFASMLIARYSCMHCQYARIERVADYTVGDFHGYRMNDYEKGISLVICKDERLYKELSMVESLSYEDSSLADAISSNSRLYAGWDALRYHPANVFRSLFYKMPYNQRLKILTNKFPYSLLWASFKVFTKINIEIQKKLVLKKI